MAKSNIKPVVKKSRVSNYVQPKINNVATKITLSDPTFLPVYPNESSSCAELKAFMPMERRVQMPHRATVTIDCGFACELQAGYKAVITADDNLARRGLMVTCPYRENQSGNLRVTITNIGKEIIVINHGDIFAKIAIEPIYRFDFVKGETA